MPDQLPTSRSPTVSAASSPAGISSERAGAEVTKRIYSIDVYRGMVMFLMLAELMHLNHLAEKFPGIGFFEWLRFHTSHVVWEGCSLHDLIQPGFTFLVGVAMPFSIGSRLRRGGSRFQVLVHAAWRSLVLITLGIFLRSLGYEQTRFTFDDTLTQIGLGYFFAVCLAMSPRWAQWSAVPVILIGFWGAYATSSPPPVDFDYPSVGVPADWPHHHDGFASRFNKNSNLSWRFDVWFMNLFPRESRFDFAPGGYATLSFIPTLATMLLGLFAGRWMRELATYGRRMQRLLFAGVLCLVVGYGWAASGFCPSIKRIWTPSWTLVSGGYCFLWLATLHTICDRMEFKRWAFPFVVIGANSILIYVMSWTVADPMRDALYRHFGHSVFSIFGEAFNETVTGALTIAMLFAVLLWLYRRKVFIKI